MSDEVKDGKGKVIQMQVERVMSREEVKVRDHRMREHPEYHLIVMHRSGRVVYQRNFIEAADFDCGFTDADGKRQFDLHQDIIEDVERFEDSRKPREQRRPPKPLPEIQ